MALASAPATPERTGGPQVFRRSFTAPPRPAKTSLPLNDSEVQGAETLFVHSSGKIVSFSTPNKSIRRHSSISDTRSDFDDEPVGVLPWASITERTIAAGPLQIYRVLGSVAFLNSGKILQPLLAKSQCWCVDGVSKFVLRIRPNTYYRIELPCNNPADEEAVEQIKKVLKNILQYEVTPCPFKRGFTVDLPEPPQTPIYKRPWRPKVPFNANVEEVTEEHETLEPLEDETAINRSPGDLGLFCDPSAGPKEPERRLSKTKFESEEDTAPDRGDIVSSEVVKKHVRAIEADGTADEPSYFKTPTRPKPLRGGRTVTAPPQLSLRTSPPSTNGGAIILPPNGEDQKVPHFSSSVESFHSFHSPISPLPLSPPSSNSSPDAPSRGIDATRVRRHKRDTSEVTVTLDKQELWDLTDASAGDTEYHSPPDVPKAIARAQKTTSEETRPNSTQAESESSGPRVRLRNTRRSRNRPTSPLPSSSNLYSPYSPRANMSGHHLTTAILQRTCSLLLGPPVQLVALMLRIAAKITRGVLHGSAFGFNNDGQRIPCSWDFSDGSGDDEDNTTGTEEDEDEEDDYGISLGKTISGKEVRSRDLGGSWEID